MCIFLRYEASSHPSPRKTFVLQTICFKNDKVLTNVHFMKSILSDIFPGNNCTTPTDCDADAASANVSSSPVNSPSSPIRHAILDACSALNINATNYFVEKVLQLYEMLHIRAGIMIIGDSFAGKTTAYRILAKALAILHTTSLTTTTAATVTVAEKKESHPVCSIINPKSVTIGQLYGVFDSSSHEWRDGILAINFKHFINAGDGRKWLIFDGPVDTVWMENINSVLDDNRKLCLVSGDIFHLTKSMNLLFEPMDLSDASPAIVNPSFYCSTHLVHV